MEKISVADVLDAPPADRLDAALAGGR